MKMEKRLGALMLLFGSASYGGIEIRVKEVLKDEAHARNVCERLCGRRKMVNTGHSFDSRQGRDANGQAVDRNYSCSCYCEIRD